MKILHLPIKKRWFEMIREGIKKEEYREIKEYWEKRLVINWGFPLGVGYKSKALIHHKEFDIIRFKNGYQKNASVMDVEFKGIEIRGGNPYWGAIKGEEYFVILLGDVLNYSLNQGKGRPMLYNSKLIQGLVDSVENIKLTPNQVSFLFQICTNRNGYQWASYPYPTFTSLEKRGLIRTQKKSWGYIQTWITSRGDQWLLANYTAKTHKVTIDEANENVRAIRMAIMDRLAS